MKVLSSPLASRLLPVPVAGSSHASKPCHLRHPSRPWHVRVTHASPQEEVDVGGDNLIEADIERMRRRSGQSFNTTPTPAQQEESSSPFSGVKETIDKVLIADFFLVLFALAWLGVGVVLANASGTGSSPVLDAWFPLWPTLWQSAIGLLMAGALVSGGLGWVAEQRKPK